MCSVTDAGLTGEQFSSLFGNGAEEHVALLSTIQYSSEWSKHFFFLFILNAG